MHPFLQRERGLLGALLKPRSYLPKIEPGVLGWGGARFDGEPFAHALLDPSRGSVQFGRELLLAQRSAWGGTPGELDNVSHGLRRLELKAAGSRLVLSSLQLGRANLAGTARGGLVRRPRLSPVLQDRLDCSTLLAGASVSHRRAPSGSRRAGIPSGRAGRALTARCCAVRWGRCRRCRAARGCC